MIQFSIGLSALQSAQQGLAIAGNNLANASTPGYHRQIAQLATLGSTQDGNISVGAGVTVAQVQRIVNDQLDAALNQQTSLNSFVDSSLATSTQIQQTISPGISSPSTQLEGLLNSLQSLSASPTSGASQQAVVASAQTAASAFNSAASSFSQIQQGLDQSISGAIGQINSLSKQIADLNGQISTATNVGADPNNLLDQRSQLITNLSQLVNVQVQNSTNGQVTVIASGGLLVAGTQAETLTSGKDNNGATTISVTGTDSNLGITSGQLGGFLSERNNTLTDFQNRLDTLAKQVAASFNAIQSTGLGAAGAFTQINGTNGVTSTTAPLSAAGLSFPPTTGSLYIGVTDKATGVRTVTEIPVNPQNQSLQDVANAIGTAVPNVNAFVNTQTGTLSLIAANGYSFDFTGGVDTNPTTNFPGGSTTSATVGGTYSGQTNDNYTYSFTSSGTVGVTPNLQLQVTNAAGATVGTYNVGQGYQANKPITIANGLTVTLAAGDVTAGDSFSSKVVANPDSAGLLSALGLNTLFSGNNAASLSVNSQIVSDPSLISTSRSGQPGDTSNLQRFAALGTSTVLTNGTQTFSQYGSNIVSDIGTQVQSLTQQQSSNQTVTTSLTNQQQSISGVDTNEELSKILQYQQMFQLAGKYISTVNDTLQSLISITL